MKFLIKQRLKKQQSQDITTSDITNAKTVLFAIFSRYGDGIISFVVIKEFIQKYPNKQYLVATSRQQLPYLQEIINLPNIKLFSINKRNPISFFKALYIFKKQDIDIAFNPWSRGEDSEYYLTFAKKFIFFRAIDNFAKTENLYNRIRTYLHLEIQQNRVITRPNFNNIKTIIIAPFSTDVKKNMTVEQVNYLIDVLRNTFSNVNITVAVSKEFYLTKFNAQKFIWYKSTKNSKKYLHQLKHIDLFIGVDSGPLHLALALNINTIGVFGATAPATVLDYNTKILIWRDNTINNYFCQVKKCKNAQCIDNIFQQNDLLSYEYKVLEHMTYETNTCPLEFKK